MAELVLLEEECRVVGLTDMVGGAVVVGRACWGSRRVAVGSAGVGWVGEEKGRKAGESSESSSVELRGPRVGLADEKRGRRVKARLLVRGTGSSDELEDGEEFGLSLRAIGGEVEGSSDFGVGFGEAWDGLRAAGCGRGD